MVKSEPLNNRIRIDKEVLTKLQTQGFCVDNQSSLSKTIHSILEEYLANLQQTAPLFEIPTNNKSLQSTTRSVNRLKSQRIVFTKSIPNELQSFSKNLALQRKDLSSSLVDLCADAQHRCPILFDYLLSTSTKCSKRKEISDRKRFMISVCVLMMANVANEHCTNFAVALGAVLYSNGVSQQIIELLCKFGICSAYTTITNHVMNYIESRQQKFRTEVQSGDYISQVIVDTFEKRLDGKFTISENQKMLLNTITTLAVNIKASKLPNILAMNEDLLQYRFNYDVLVEEANKYHERKVDEFFLNHNDYLEGSHVHTREKYIQYECWPSFLGNGNSNVDKLKFFQFVQEDVVKEGIVVGDQVFAAFLYRAQRNRKFQSYWVLPGDWHFHQAMMKALLKLGWFFFEDLVHQLNSRLTKEGKHYNDLRVFIETFTHGMASWLKDLYANSLERDINWGVENFEQFKIFVLKLRSNSQTLDSLLNLMDIGIDCITFKRNTRSNNGQDQLFLVTRCLPLFLTTNARNYFQLTTYQVNQLEYLRQNNDEFYQLICNARNIAISESSSDSQRCVAADEFIELNHGHIQHSNIDVNPLTFPYNVQKKIYAKSLERNAITGNVEKVKHWKIHQGVEFFVQLMNERLGNTYASVMKKVGDTNCKKVISIFNGEKFSAKVFNPLTKDSLNGYSDCCDMMATKVSEELEKTPTNPFNVVDDVVDDDVDELEEFATKQQFKGKDDVLNIGQLVTINTYNHKAATGRSLGNFYENPDKVILGKRNRYKGLKASSQDREYLMADDSDEDYDDTNNNSAGRGLHF